MAPQAYLMVLTAGSALVGMWLAVRFERIAPKTGRGAALCIVAAWLLSGLVGPFFAAARLHLPIGLALFVATFPVFAVTFALVAAALRYFVGLLGHATR